MTFVTSLVWLGPAPPASLREALAREKLRAAADGDGPIVRFTRRGRPPSGNMPTPWIWVAQAPIADPDAVNAVLHGAYATVSLASPDAAAQLVARIRELLTPQPAMNPPGHLVLHSDAARRVL